MPNFRRVKLLLCSPLLSALFVSSFTLPSYQNPGDYDDLTPRWEGISLPAGIVAMVAQPDYYRWWIVTRGGAIMTLPDAAVEQGDLEEVLDISGRVSGDIGYTENGLLGFAFSPHWTEDRNFFIYYTDIREGSQSDVEDLDAGRLDPYTSHFQYPSCQRTDNEGWPRTAMLSRFTWYEGDPEATRKSEKVLLYWGNLSQVYHIGGALLFAGEYLHLGAADNTDSWQCQSLDTPKGKILRINPFESDNGRPYAVPPNNPFVGQTPPDGHTWYHEIYVYGVRNPFRCVADDNERIACGIVGQDNVESIVMLKSGANFGYPDYEGSKACISEGDPSTHRTVEGCNPVVVEGTTCNTQPLDYELTGPLFSYCHSDTVPSGIFDGACSSLLVGALPVPISFYRGAGDVAGLIQKGDLLFSDSSGTYGAVIVRLRPSEQDSWADSATIVYGPTDDNPYMSTPYFVTTAVDWNGEFMIIRYDAVEMNHVYRWDGLNYEDYPDGPVMSGGEPVPEPVPAPSPNKEKTLAPFAPIPVPTSDVCGGDAYNYPEVNWTQHADGTYSGNLTFGALTYTTTNGTTTTRGYFSEDGAAMLPGPIIRMKPGGVYNLTLVNALSTDWPNPEGQLNEPRLPCVTNLHLHGLHISSKWPSDYMPVEVRPGDAFTYTYVIPVDHTGGTHIYHSHVHGSTALLAGAGAAGMLIIEDNEYLEANTVWPNMPEAVIVMQALTPQLTERIAGMSGDRLYQTAATSNYYLVNGCDEQSFNLEVVGGEWTRLRFLHLGGIGGSIIVTIEAANETAANTTAANTTQCDVALLAKDGVYLSDVPRNLPEPKLLFSISSRVDVAVRCATEGMQTLTISSAKQPDTLLFAGNFSVIANASASDDNTTSEGDLQPWTPLRPYYLTDLHKENVTSEPYVVAVRANAINGVSFQGYNMDPLLNINEGSLNQWLIQFSNAHPLHVHINHLQLFGNVTNYPSMPNWHQEGDWLDTIDFPGDQLVRFRADRFGGKMMVHCHVYEHSDKGMIAFVQINGGEGSGGGLAVQYWPEGLQPSSCNGVLEMGETEDICENGIAQGAAAETGGSLSGKRLSICLLPLLVLQFMAQWW